MKYTLISCSVFLAFLFYYAAAQNFEDPKLYYQPTKFDDEMRGSFNVTPCLRELLKCWEVITPDMFCHVYQKLTTMCELRFRHCYDEYGWPSNAYALPGPDRGDWQWWSAYDLACPPVTSDNREYWQPFGYANNWYWYGHPSSRRRRRRRRRAAAGARARPPATDVVFWL